MIKRVSDNLAAMPSEEIIRIIQRLSRGEVETLKHAKDATILWALDHTHGDVGIAAQLLGTSRSTVYRCARAYTDYAL